MSTRSHFSSLLKQSFEKLQRVVEEIDSARIASTPQHVQSTRPESEMPQRQQIMTVPFGTNSTDAQREGPSSAQTSSYAPPQSEVRGLWTSSAASATADEEAKSYILATRKQIFMDLLKSQPAQLPITKFLESGVLETYWASENDMFVLFNGDNNFPHRSGIEEKMRYVEMQISQSSSRDSVHVRCEIIRGKLTCVRETYPSYHTMIQMCLQDSQKQAAQMKQLKDRQQMVAAQVQSQMETQALQLQSEQDQRNAMIRRHEERMTKLGQMTGSTPLYYKNGVPHYRGF